MSKLRSFVILPIAALVLAACQSTGSGSPSPGGGGDDTACADASGDDLLARICEAGLIKVSTDPEYPPQSFLDPETNELDGFDIDVAKEIAKRLGVEAEFETPSFDAVVAGAWSERWDMSVGSVTITPERAEVLDFTQAYYFTPAQMSALSSSGFTSLDDFAGTTVCVGSGTTYFFWLNGELTLPEEAGEITDPPADVEVTTLETDTDCAESWQAGRTDFEGWLTAYPTALGVQADGLEIDLVGDPVFYEPLAVAFDKAVEDNDSLVAAVDAIIGEMHEDGTLTALSEEWYDGTDYSTQE